MLNAVVVQVIEHKADVARLQIQQEVGGIYLDTDVVFLKSVDELRKYKMVLAEEQWDGLSKMYSMIICRLEMHRNTKITKAILKSLYWE